MSATNGQAASPSGRPLPPFGDGAQPTSAAEPTNPAAPQEEKPPAVSSNGRDNNGRFAKGWKGGPGNPFARKVAKLRSSLINAVTETDIAEVVQALLKRAKLGWPAEAKLLLMYVVGKPTEAPNPDAMDLEEFRLLETFPTRAELVRALLDGLPPDQAVAWLRQALPRDLDGTAAKLFPGIRTEGQGPDEDLDDGDLDDWDDEDEGPSYGMATEIQSERQRHRQRR